MSLSDAPTLLSMADAVPRAFRLYRGKCGLENWNHSKIGSGRARWRSFESHNRPQDTVMLAFSDKPAMALAGGHLRGAFSCHPLPTCRQPRELMIHHTMSTLISARSERSRQRIVVMTNQLLVLKWII